MAVAYADAVNKLFSLSTDEKPQDKPQPKETERAS